MCPPGCHPQLLSCLLHCPELMPLGATDGRWHLLPLCPVGQGGRVSSSAQGFALGSRKTATALHKLPGTSARHVSTPGLKNVLPGVAPGLPPTVPALESPGPSLQPSWTSSEHWLPPPGLSLEHSLLHFPCPVLPGPGESFICPTTFPEHLLRADTVQALGLCG